MGGMWYSIKKKINSEREEKVFKLSVSILTMNFYVLLKISPTLESDLTNWQTTYNWHIPSLLSTDTPVKLFQSKVHFSTYHLNQENNMTFQSE